MFEKIKKFFIKKSVDEFIPEIKITDTMIKNESFLSKADFIFNNCREYLLNTIETASRLQKKVILILTFIFSFVSISLFKVIHLIIESKKFNLTILDKKMMIFFISIIIIYAVISLILTLKGIYPKLQAINGNEPENLLVQENINQHISMMKIGEAITYQKRININKLSNNNVAYWVKFSIIILIITPFIAACLSIFLHF